MSETWTEYAVRFSTGWTYRAASRRDAERVIAEKGGAPTLVGRNVTASDWLPVDTDGAK